MKIRDCTASDFDAWKVLFTAYNIFYRAEISDDQLKTTFSWILDPNHQMQAYVVEDDGKLIALAHYMIQPHSMTANYRMFLDDLYVEEAARGRGCADMIIKHLKEECAKNNYAMLRWTTEHNNYRARALYDKYATITPFITYSLDPKDK